MQVTYWYPYIGYWGDNYKYGLDYDESRVYLSGNYTYPIVSKTQIPNVSQFKFSVSVWSQYTGLFNRQWYVYGYTSNNSWEVLHTYTLPEYTDNGADATSGERYSATIKLDISLSTKKNIKKIATVPTSRMGSSVTWSIALDIEKAEITEDITELSLKTSNCFCGLFTQTSYYSLNKTPAEVQVNIGNENLVSATDILVNIDGELVSLLKMKTCDFIATEKEQIGVITFSPPKSCSYSINTYTQSTPSVDGDSAYFWVCDSDMKELTSISSSKNVTLEAGKTYYIFVIDVPYYTALAHRVIKIYTE